MPLYIVVFAGFVGYSLMITVFTPMLLRTDGGMLSAGTSTSTRAILLGVLLCLYPAGQFVGSPAPVPARLAALWPLLFLTALGVAIALPSCASLLSNAADPAEEGRVMGNNQALQVAAEALSGRAAGFLAAIIVKLPLLVLGGVAIVAAILVAALI